MFKSWDEMTDAEKAEINRQEDVREARKEAMAASDEPDEADLAEWRAREEERMGGHKDSLYW